MNLFLGIASLLVADNHDRLTHKSCQAANDGMIIGKIPVAMKLFEVGEEMLDIIERVGALRMPGNLGNLPRGELRIDTAGKRLAFLLQTVNFCRNIHRRIVLGKTQLLDFCFKLSDGLLEIQEGNFHGIRASF